jgi:molybdate transport system substrate-binding protein
MLRKILSLVVLLTALFCSAIYAQKITVAAAANAQFVMNDIKDTFQKQTGIEVDVIIGSSGKLTSQIEQSAPFDVFVSADTKYPTELFTKGFTMDSPKVYAQGLLVLWSTKKTIKLNPDLKVLLSDSVSKIAIANPETAPYGLAAVEAMKYSKVYESVKNKLVFGESIAQTNEYITTSAADVGFTAKSVVLSDEMKGKGSWIDIDKKSYSPIDQAAVVIRHTGNADTVSAVKFYNFLFSKQAKAIFRKYGYIVN